MTQIKKTLSIAGIIAMVGAPAMADIASTEYVQNIVNNMIPKTGTVGHVLKKTATGLEWAAAPTTTLATTTGQDTTTGMTQKAITDALDKKLGNNATDNFKSVAIGDGATAVGENVYGSNMSSVAIGLGAGASGGGMAIGDATVADGFLSVALGAWSEGHNGGIGIGGGRAFNGGIAIGTDVDVDGGGIGIGEWVQGVQNGAIGLGYSIDYVAPDTLVIGFGQTDYIKDVGVDYTLLNSKGIIPAERLVSGWHDIGEGSDRLGYTPNNGTAGQLLQTNGDGTMSWVNAPAAPTLASLLPELPSACNAVKCALVHDNTDGAYKWEVVKVSE